MIKRDSEMVYLDYAAATPVDPRVVEEMMPFFMEEYGNAGSLHRFGMRAKEALTNSRKTCAKIIHSKEEEVIFTGSGTESNNIALLGALRALEDEGRKLKEMHVITTEIEHPSVLDCLKDIELRGASVTYLPVKESGRVNPEELREALTENTVLISIMYVNNEMGAVQPIGELSDVVKRFRRRSGTKKPYFHVDASQAAIALPLDVRKLDIDYLTIDAQKIYGPKGVGLLYIKNGAPIKPLIIGGNQERGLRPATENIPAIVGFAKAFSIVSEEREVEAERLRKLRDYLIRKIKKELPTGVINGPVREGIAHRMANNINVSFPNIEGEFLVIALSDRGYACGTRSACITGGGPSYVMTAMGRRSLASNSLRISLGRYTKKEDMDGLIEALKIITNDFDT
jgi:cysteine desulfurase